MTNAFAAQAASFALAAAMTVATLCTANAMANHQYVVTEAAAHVQLLATQTVTVVGHRHANA